MNRQLQEDNKRYKAKLNEMLDELERKTIEFKNGFGISRGIASSVYKEDKLLKKSKGLQSVHVHSLDIESAQQKPVSSENDTSLLSVSPGKAITPKHYNALLEKYKIAIQVNQELERKMKEVIESIQQAESKLEAWREEKVQ